ncbi:pre-mRNA-splicing factor CWC22, putative [Plasmodium malariae]|uniref:Pre-mRNA-splicing factor CWC22, putative n=2 Tax=Plasmodium malariae TaxID=5858 RepID=A0A1D3TFE9_PLAMA|nr:pre-mRNA-splicing factor CWC22, putative [Plasmodium malariae]SCP03665.1 pre-mRNA-splicing factor CWC22, putative [Plasmodium malariae]
MIKGKDENKSKEKISLRGERKTGEREKKKKKKKKKSHSSSASSNSGNYYCDNKNDNGSNSGMRETNSRNRSSLSYDEDKRRSDRFHNDEKLKTKQKSEASSKHSYNNYYSGRNAHGRSKINSDEVKKIKRKNVKRSSSFESNINSRGKGNVRSYNSSYSQEEMLHRGNNSTSEEEEKRKYYTQNRYRRRDERNSSNGKENDKRVRVKQEERKRKTTKWTEKTCKTDEMNGTNETHEKNETVKEGDTNTFVPNNKHNMCQERSNTKKRKYDKEVKACFEADEGNEKKKNEKERIKLKVEKNYEKHKSYSSTSDEEEKDENTSYEKMKNQSRVVKHRHNKENIEEKNEKNKCEKRIYEIKHIYKKGDELVQKKRKRRNEPSEEENRKLCSLSKSNDKKEVSRRKSNRSEESAVGSTVKSRREQYNDETKNMKRKTESKRYSNKEHREDASSRRNRAISRSISSSFHGRKGVDLPLHRKRNIQRVSSELSEYSMRRRKGKSDNMGHAHINMVNEEKEKYSKRYKRKRSSSYERGGRVRDRSSSNSSINRSGGRSSSVGSSKRSSIRRSASSSIRRSASSSVRRSASSSVRRSASSSVRRSASSSVSSSASSSVSSSASSSVSSSASSSVSSSASSSVSSSIKRSISGSINRSGEERDHSSKSKRRERKKKGGENRTKTRINTREKDESEEKLKQGKSKKGRQKRRGEDVKESRGKEGVRKTLEKGKEEKKEYDPFEEDENGHLEINEELIEYAKKKIANVTTEDIGKTGGVYIPPFKLERLQNEVTNKKSSLYQKQEWIKLKKKINNIVNKVNIDNIGDICYELFECNLIRGKGIFSRAILHAQLSSPAFTNVFACLLCIVNSKFPNIGLLTIQRIILYFRRAYKRNDKILCFNSVKFIAHMINQRMLHEIVGLQLCSLLLQNITNDSVQVCTYFLAEVGQLFMNICRRGLDIIFDRLKDIIQEGKINIKTQYDIEKLWNHRKNYFNEFPTLIDDLDLIDEDTKIVHEIDLLDESFDNQEELNIFREVPYEQYEEENLEWEDISNELLHGATSTSGKYKKREGKNITKGGHPERSDTARVTAGSSSDSNRGRSSSGSSSTDSEIDDPNEGRKRGHRGSVSNARSNGSCDSSDRDGSDDTSDASNDTSGSDHGEGNNEEIHDMTEQYLINLRKSVYLSIMSSLSFEECVHKLLKLNIKAGYEIEICNMLIDCCCMEKTFQKFYALQAERLCKLKKIFQENFEKCFENSYNTAHRLETAKLRNCSKFFAHLLFTDAISWSSFVIIKLTEEDTTASTRIFIKILLQELTNNLGVQEFYHKINHPAISPFLTGLFPNNNAQNIRFCINFFTAIGLGVLTTSMRNLLLK